MQMQATIKALQKQVQDAKSEAAAATTAAASAGNGSDIDLKVAWKGGAPHSTSEDGKKFSFKVRGRVEADYNESIRIRPSPVALT